MSDNASLRKAGHQDWLTNRQYPLKPATISGYLSSLKLFPQRLDVNDRFKQNTFSYLSASALDRAIGALFAAPNYEAANRSAHGSFNTAIKYYERFLLEREQRKAILLANAVESEARFNEWLSRQVKNYSDAIIDAYVEVLDILPPLLYGRTVVGSLYDISDPSAFYSARVRLRGSANYDAINSSNAHGFLHGALNASLNLYGLYLEYLSDSQIVADAVKRLAGENRHQLTPTLSPRLSVQLSDVTGRVGSGKGCWLSTALASYVRCHTPNCL